jgi:hypothetical protein
MALVGVSTRSNDGLRQCPLGRPIAKRFFEKIQLLNRKNERNLKRLTKGVSKLISHQAPRR